ncbi:MAG TPA: DNA polymerase III subunit epsilon [Rhodanobacteraceae bacterium]|nr:DNA polymerase III subunit epsilon [Rhodanobacteraceae bacterium]
MRQVVLDTETTGLEVGRGHRIVEIGCVELAERRQTGRTFHTYLNPDRAIDEGARAISGISDEFLLDKPRFRDIAVEFIDFVAGAEIIAHNAAFDVGFIDAELAGAGGQYGRLAEHASILDTLALAREKYPAQRNSLDALCKRHGVDNSHREWHGALLDAQLLAEVYLLMTAGQGDLGFAEETVPAERTLTGAVRVQRIGLRVLHATAGELTAHAARLAAIEKVSHGVCIWIHADAG